MQVSRAIFAPVFEVQLDERSDEDHVEQADFGIWKGLRVLRVQDRRCGRTLLSQSCAMKLLRRHSHR